MDQTVEEQMAQYPLWLCLLCGGPYDGEVVRMYGPIRPRNVIRDANGTLAQSCAPPDELRPSEAHAAYLAGGGSEYWYVSQQGND